MTYMKSRFWTVAASALLVAALALPLAACDNGNKTPADTDPLAVESTPDSENQNPSDTGDPSAPTTPTDPTDPTDPTTVRLTFNGTKLSASSSSAGIVAEGQAFVITKGGVYELSGNLSNGQLRVRVPKTEQVDLIFKGFTAASSKSAPLYVESADKVVIELAAGTVNSLTDAAVYQFADPSITKPNACLYSADDLTIKGDGSLTVTGNYNNGIASKNDLRIKGGQITVSAPNNILKGGDSVLVEKGTLKLLGGEDAIKTDNEVDLDKGTILIMSEAKINIQCLDDALQATQGITVEAGATITGTAGGDAANCPGVINIADGSMQLRSAS
jgi:hypothetical protein